MDNKERFRKILEPGYIGKVKTRNRMIKAANGTSFIEPSGFIGERALGYYDALARGGVGLLIVESCGVEYPLGVQHPPVQFHLDDDKYIPSYAELVKVIHSYGCPAFIQFQHAGPWNPTGLLPKRDTKAASALTQEELPGPDFAVPRGLSHDEVLEYIDIWASAAERAARAGFDGCEINGGTCHQINTFLSRIFNKRDDEYGCQNTENRSRFICDIVRETKKRVGGDFAVTALINIAEYGHKKGTTMQEGVEFAKYLQDAGADAIQCRAHGYGHRGGLIQPDRVLYPEPPEWLPKELDWSRNGVGATVPLVEAVKKKVTIPVFAACRLDPIVGEEYLRKGKLDFVSMVRRLLADPELPNKVIEGRLEDITPCTGCLYCMDVRNRNKPLECRVNASLGREKEYAIKPAATKKKVLVAGGGPAGLEAARVAALRGHEVTLYDKSSKPGGLIPLAAVVKDLEIDCLMDLIEYYKIQFNKLGVKMEMGKEVDPDLIADTKPDVLIVAAGGVHSTFDVPASGRSRVVNSARLHKQLQSYLKFLGPKMLDKLTRLWMPLGKKVTIIGGDIIGCELAEFLAKRGRTVNIVHAGEELGEGMTRDDFLRLLPWLEKKGAATYTGAKFEEVTDAGLVITTREGKKTILVADTIVVALPLLPNKAVIKNLGGKARETYAIGSCAEPGLVVNAIADGARIGREI
jgi:2,4-dienoyl-CoA reductase (NADPH2)